MELDDERKLSLGPQGDIQENKRILFDAIKVKQPELMAKISKNANYKSPIYNYFSTTIWRWTRQLPEESCTSSVDDSMTRQDLHTQSQGGPSQQHSKQALSSSMQVQPEHQRFPKFTKQDERDLFDDHDEEFFDKPPIETSEMNDKVDDAPMRGTSNMEEAT